MSFKAAMHAIKKGPKGIEALMGAALAMYEGKVPPSGSEGCEDCKRLNEPIRQNST